MINNYKELKRETLDFFVNAEIKPCPWCGDVPNLSFNDGGSPYGYLSLECNDCQLTPNITKKYYEGKEELNTLKYLIDGWNTRKNENPS